MKKSLILMTIIFFMFAMAGCNLLDTIFPVVPVETLSAGVDIINWVQDNGNVEVTYEISNTGTVDIAYYKLEFAVTYADDSVYMIWHEKEGIVFADSEIVEFVIEVSDEVARVDIVDLKLTEWKFE